MPRLREISSTIATCIITIDREHNKKEKALLLSDVSKAIDSQASKVGTGKI
jgi:hypothetical protein